MASEEPIGGDAEALSAAEAVVRPPRRPFYKDPLSIIGWGLALASIIAYWFFFVRKPIPKPGQEVALFTALAGKVRVKPNAREAWEEARHQERLHVGDVVQTEPKAGAEIQFDTGSLVRVRPDSVVYVGGSAESSTAAWRVESGRVSFSARKDEEIITPTARTVVQQDASGNIDVGEGGDTGVRIFEGSAQVRTTQGQTISVGQNQALQVDASGKAGATVDLPPPPRLLAPAAKAELPFVPPPGSTTRLSWEPVRNGATYHVAIDYNVVQANLLLSAALDEQGIRDTSHELQGLDKGRYFWRVAAVNTEGLEGAYSRLSLFSVVPPVAPTPPPEPDVVEASALTLADVEEVSPGVVHVHGRTKPGSTLTIDGHTVGVSPDGSFSEYVRRSETGEVLVRATGPDGQTSEQARPVVNRR